MVGFQGIVVQAVGAAAGSLVLSWPVCHRDAVVLRWCVIHLVWGLLRLFGFVIWDMSALVKVTSHGNISFELR